MADRLTLPFFPSVDCTARVACFKAAWLKQLDVNAALEQRIEALERRLAVNSKTSSLPPSNDGLRKPAVEKRTRSQRGKSGRKSGGQPGHKGETLRQTLTPDRVINHYPEICNGCGADFMARIRFQDGADPGVRQKGDVAKVLSPH